MMAKLISILRAIGNSKFKMFLVVMSVLVFLYMLFPVNDLGDYVSSQVALATKSDPVFLQFEDLQVSLLPTPGLKVSKVYVENAAFPPILVQEIKVVPSVSGLISQQPYGSVNAKGLFGGDVSVQVKSGARSDTGIVRQRIELTASRLDLPALRDLGRIPVAMKGKIDLTTMALVDLTFTEQPEVEVNLGVSQFEILPSMVNLGEMGDIALPEIKISRVDVKGRLSAGKLIIESGTFGKEGDDLQGTVKGSIDLQMVKAKNDLTQEGGVHPVLGGYTLFLDLKPSPKLQESAATMFDIFIGKFKVMASDGVHYKFKTYGENFNGMAKFDDPGIK